MNSFFDALHRFVDRECNTQIQTVKALWAQSISQRVAQGEAIADVRVESVEPLFAHLSFSENLSKFRPGDTVRLNRGRPDQLPSYAVRIEAERNDGLTVRAGYKTRFDTLEPGSGWALDREIFDMRRLLHEALYDLQTLATPGTLHVADILQGNVEPSFEAVRRRKAVELAGQAHLDGSQAEAFVRAYAARDYDLIQGPPGTGKTYLLAHLATALARDGQRVLVTGFTHRAISNALRKIAQTTGYVPVAKIGQPWRAGDLTWEDGSVPNFMTYEAFQCGMPVPRGRGIILGATCFALRSSRLSGVHFDTVIFDEAGQVTLPLAVAGMLAASRAIFIGDHQQLAPVVVAEHDPPWVASSVFEHLVDTARGTMLTTTYRMNEELTDFPSRAFYGGRLTPSDGARQRRLHLGGQPGPFARFLAPTPCSIFAVVKGANHGMRAPEEARLAAGIVAEALERGLPPNEIAVVAPYRAQVRLIRAALRERGVEPADDGVIADTVERIQGQEREVILFSLTTSDADHAARRADFLFQPNRLNVAITRPRVKRIVIGDPCLFDAQPSDPRHRAWVDTFRSLYDASHIIRGD